MAYCNSQYWYLCTGCHGTTSGYTVHSNPVAKADISVAIGFLSILSLYIAHVLKASLLKSFSEYIPAHYEHNPLSNQVAMGHIHNTVAMATITQVLGLTITICHSNTRSFVALITTSFE
jgi:hypothetical protein